MVNSRLASRRHKRDADQDEIRNRAGKRGQVCVADDVFEIARDDQHELDQADEHERKPEAEDRAEDDQGREQQRPDGIGVKAIDR